CPGGFCLGELALHLMWHVAAQPARYLRGTCYDGTYGGVMRASTSAGAARRRAGAPPVRRDEEHYNNDYRCSCIGPRIGVRRDPLGATNLRHHLHGDDRQPPIRL